MNSSLILIDKSPGFTSHHVVSYIRKLLKSTLDYEVRVGHLGTLDPFASGLLPILIGGVTRLSDEMMDGKKQYLFQIKLGEQTDTLDSTGQVTQEVPVPENYIEKIKSNLNQFIGEIEQIPPVYSALKMQGRPLYEYMRSEGKLPQDIETKKRKIFIDKIELIENKLEEKNTVTIRVLCAKGTYVRSLARDLAATIGTVGYCSSLRRECVEPWHVDNALLFSEDIKPSFEEMKQRAILPHHILPHVPQIEIPSYQSKIFCAGNIVTLSCEDLPIEKWDACVQAKVCFANTKDQAVMYYCIAEKLNDKFLKIKPSKKIT
jgi:tRNA pseudouridine55 synthase